MSAECGRPDEDDKQNSHLHVKTDRTTRELFGAACKMAGETIQDAVNRLMRETIDRAGIGTSANHH